MTFVLVLFTACWIAHATPVPTKSECEALTAGLLATLASTDRGVQFSAECHPGDTDLKMLEQERWQTFACFHAPMRADREPEGR